MTEWQRKTANFEISPGFSNTGPRLGSLCLEGRNPISTPHYIATTSRGAVPHISQDIFRDQTSIKGVYVALEDFVERLPEFPPVYGVSSTEPLRTFIALQKDAVLVLGPRRNPPVPPPQSNSDTGIVISTSVGFRSLQIGHYIDAAARLNPDILLGIVDVESWSPSKLPSLKRRDKVGARSISWMAALSKELAVLGQARQSKLWAPILSIAPEMQREYLELVEEMKGQLGGLVLYDNASVSAIPAMLMDLPRLAITAPSTPQELLQVIFLGADITSVPFLTAATDMGVALTFKFPPETSISGAAPLGINLWNTAYATDLAALDPGCECYACSFHHRAYLQHLLAAKEMLAWVLLQIHNLSTIDKFFAGVRTSLKSGKFEEDRCSFEGQYESDLPVSTGEKPRLRGYQVAPKGPGPNKQNRSAYRKLRSTPIVMADTDKRLEEEQDVPNWGANFEAADFESLGLANRAE